MSRKTILYIEDLDVIAETEIDFLDEEYDIIRPKFSGEALAQAMLQYLHPEYWFDVLLQDLHLDHYKHGEYRDPRLRAAVIEYRNKVNPNLCWLILSGTVSDELKEAQKFYAEADGVYQKTHATGDVLVDIIKDHLSRK